MDKDYIIVTATLTGGQSDEGYEYPDQNVEWRVRLLPGQTLKSVTIQTPDAQKVVEV